MASVMNSSRRRLSLDVKLWLQCQIPTEEDCLGCRTVATMCLGSRTVATVLNSSRKRLSLDINLELQC